MITSVTSCKKERKETVPGTPKQYAKHTDQSWKSAKIYMSRIQRLYTAIVHDRNTTIKGILYNYYT